MMNIRVILFLLAASALFSCKWYSGKKVQLPQVDSAYINKVDDYSSIYVFFDEKTSAYDLNNNNLITSTHWVFHIDRRIGLASFFEVIHMMQRKKARPSMHSKPDSKNYISVLDKFEHNLAFIDITPTMFFTESATGSEAVTVLSEKKVMYKAEEISLSHFISDYYTQYTQWNFSSQMSVDTFLNTYELLRQKGVVLHRIYIL